MAADAALRPLPVYLIVIQGAQRGMKGLSCSALNEVSIIMTPLSPTPVPGEGVSETECGLTMDTHHSPSDSTIKPGQSGVPYCSLAWF